MVGGYNDTQDSLAGAGRIGQAHSRAVAQTVGAELVAVSDVSAEAARTIADQHHCQTASMDEIAENPEIDAVLICTQIYMQNKLKNLLPQAKRCFVKSLLI